MDGAVCKALADIAPVDDESASGSFRVILSTPTEDRDGEEVLTNEWELPLPDHITFDIDHGMSVASTVGSGVPSIDVQGRLIVDGTYSSIPRAQEVRTLVNERHTRTVSVAFLRSVVEGADGTRTIRRELLNGAFVAVPANPEAVVVDSKELDLKEGRRNASSDQERIQQLHDLALDLGAACAKSATPAGAAPSGTDTEPSGEKSGTPEPGAPANAPGSGVPDDEAERVALQTLALQIECTASEYGDSET